MTTAALTGRIARWCLALLVLPLAACSSMHYPLNTPLTAESSEPEYTLDSQAFRQPGDEELLVVLTFSGGGTRAAALSFGVIEELARQEIVWKGQRKRLIDEVDIVYGVSGGSITAAYWSLRGDRILDEFPKQFLSRNLQQQLLDDVTSVTNLWRLNSSRFGRGDLLAEHLDRVLFKKATFADLASTARPGPYAVISATDISNGARFDFTQEFFNLICSDINAMPLARAVAASSAVPVVFSPISLWNYGKRCPRPRPTADSLSWLQSTRGLALNRSERRVADLLEYVDADKRPYVHLVDGGVADNLALRGMMELEGIYQTTGQNFADRQPWINNVKQALIIVVDAGTEPASHLEQSPDVPRLTDVVASLADIPIQRFSDETRYMFQRTLEHWQRFALSRRQAGQEMALHVAEVSLEVEPEPELRKRMVSLPTTLYLPDEEVNTLRLTGARLLRESAGFQQLLRGLGADLKSAPTSPTTSSSTRPGTPGANPM